MNIYISLNKQISCEYLCERINRSIEQYKKTENNLDGCVLDISIRAVSINNDETIPKLELINSNDKR